MSMFPENTTVRLQRPTHARIAVTLAVALLGGCATSTHSTSTSGGPPEGEVALYAAQATQRPKPEQKAEKQRPPRPKPQPQRPSQRPSPPVPRGSGDPIPVAAFMKPGEAVRGVVGAIWADANNDGVVDGYVYNDQYYAGTPAGYDLILDRAVPGGAVRGAAAGSIIPGVSVIEGAIIGAAVGGLQGAVWADRDNDGIVDGYIYNGQYYQGAPSATVPAPAVTPIDAGERG